LQAPDGTQVPLVANVSESNANFSNTVFDDRAPSSITSAAAPFSGTFSPAPGILSSMLGKNLLGIWHLLVNNTGTQTGTLNSWTITPFSVTPVYQAVGTPAIGQIGGQQVTSATPTAGGSGYNGGDILNVQGGTTATTAAQLQVTTVSAGSATVAAG